MARRNGGGPAGGVTPKGGKNTPAPKAAAPKAPAAKGKPAPPPAKGAKTPSSKKRKRFALTDQGNTERLVHLAGSDFKYVAAWGKYIVWVGSMWVRDGSGGRMLRMTKRVIEDIEAEAKEHGKDEDKAKGVWKWYYDSQALNRRNAIIRAAHGEYNVEIDVNQLDADPWLLGVKNGVLDLRTGKLLPADRKYLITKRTNIDFKRDAKAPKWHAFLKQVIPDDDVRDFVQRYVGYCLTGRVTERMFCILHGGGRNGKSVFLGALQDLLGPYAVSTAPGLLMSRQNDAHPTEVADLHNIRLAISSEVKKGRVIDEEQLKRLTGNDRLKARRMNEDFWEFEPTFKLMIAANHKPQVRDDTDSFWDRLALIPFNTRIPDGKVDPHLRAKFKQELSGILAWAVEGCLKWQKDGIAKPDAIKAATDDYRRNEDIIGKFFEEMCRFGKGFQTKSATLASAVKKWCEDNNLTYTFREKDLAEKLVANGAVRGRVGPKVDRARGWIGLGMVVVKDGKWEEPKPLRGLHNSVVDGDDDEPELIKPGTKPGASVPPPAETETEPEAPPPPKPRTRRDRIAGSPGVAQARPEKDSNVIAISRPKTVKKPIERESPVIDDEDAPPEDDGDPDGSKL